MPFVLTLLYIPLSLLSADIFPEPLRSAHLNLIVGILLILLCLPAVVRSKIAAIPESYLITGVLLTATVSVAATGWLGGAIDTFLTFMPIVFTFFFIAITCQSVRRLQILTGVLTATALFIISQGTYAEFSGNIDNPYLLTEAIHGTALYRIRGLGVLSDPNDLAQVLVTLLPLLWLRWKKKRPAANLFFTLIPASLLVTGIILTHSRGGAMALMVVLLYGFKDRLGLIKTALLGGIGGVGLLVLNVGGGRGMSEDDGDRVGLWLQALNAFRTSPLVGIGVGHFLDFSDNGLTAHNSYVLCLAEMGLIGYFFWMGTVVSSVSELSRIAGAAAKKEDASAEQAPEPLSSWNPAAAPLQRHSLQLQSAAGPAGQLSGPEPWAASMPWLAGPDMPEAAGEDALPGSDLVYAARIVRTAFAGLLVAGFFISRTYSMIVYVMFGMAAALRLASLQAAPQEQPLALRTLLKRISLVVAGSILLLFLIVRFGKS